MFLLQNVNGNDKVIIIADTRHTQRWSEHKVDPMLCKGDLALFFICPVMLESLRLWAHERTLGIPRNVETGKLSNLRTFSVRSLKIDIVLDVIRCVS